MPPLSSHWFVPPAKRVVASAASRSLTSGFLRKRAALVLSDGSSYEGWHFGADRSTQGHVVFSTNMTGYPESMTDPSYCDQILNFTYPLVGNYGVPSAEKDKWGLHKYLESDHIWVNGILVSEYHHQMDHWQATRTLSEWMDESGVPGLSGIDTRALTKRIRSEGTLLARIETPGNLGAVGTAFVDPADINLIAKVSTKEVKTYGDGANHVVVVDCGAKSNILRHLLERDTRLTVVPHDYDYTGMAYDGVFVSNGPGDPRHSAKTVEVLRKAMEGGKPIFGICMGNQMMALAAGADITKLPFGNRGHNQPVINTFNGKASVTSQNHGYAVDESTLPAGWQPLFRNLNDHSNEGLIHATKPFASAQFHPEARGGPTETVYLFDQFVAQCRQSRLGRPVANFYKHPSLLTPKKVLVLGSGGLQIGQAGEFDYSGSQALKAYSSMGIETVLMNPNIASIQTSPGLADSVYYLPVNEQFVTEIIENEKPDAIALAFGGQTALNVGVALSDSGVLAKHGVRVLGTSVESIKMTEDRDLFVEKLKEINQPTPVSIATHNIEEAIEAANEIGYPVICRAAYALGGLGSGFCEDEAELRKLLAQSFTKSPQVLVERDLRGWKEVEYEVVRDSQGNAITVCNMENFDPLGIHTGDSIVIAPSQTLTNDEYHLLREASINIASHLGIVGECNVQYALHPTSMEYRVIEANPRLSRSSALASKATGYPLAAVAAQLSLRVSLPELNNPITSSEEHSTSAFFEPALDYVVTKIPRWDTSKFEHVSNQLGSAMRSVGEVMSIGRTFEESLQKAVRMVNDAHQGFDAGLFKGTDELTEMVKPTPNRLFAIANMMYSGEMSVDDVHDTTKIDKWFLSRLQTIINCSGALDGTKATAMGKADGVITSSENNELGLTLRRAKELGFSDKQIASRWGMGETEVRTMRKALGIIPCVKQIDTLGGEYPATTNYLFMTYNGSEDDVKFDDEGVLVMGSGTYRIGSSVEFDYCSMKTVKRLAELGKRTIMLNHNPETVSTDYDENDRLYFDELSLERVLDVYEKESAEGIVVSVGGQAPNMIALKLHEQGANVLGTHPAQIDRCEDRGQYSEMLDKLGIEQPRWVAAESVDDAQRFASEVGFPVIVRPSYVLSGAAMAVVRSEEQLDQMLREASNVTPDHPVVVSKFVEGALEVDVDAVASKGQLTAYAISEHLERGGVHSGDATLVLPSFRLSDDQKAAMKASAAAIAEELAVSGPFNTQFLVDPTSQWIGVIETNLRASRSVPFVSKVLDVDFIANATDCTLGLHAANEAPVEAKCDVEPNHVGVKCAQFSFSRLLGADPVLGVEMHSTGEVACFGENVEEAYLKSLISTHFPMPQSGASILLCARHGAPGSLQQALDGAQQLVDSGFKMVAADSETMAVLDMHGIAATPANGDALSKREVSLVIDLSDNHKEFYPTRREAVDFSIPVVTNHEQVILLSKALGLQGLDLKPKKYDDYCPRA